VRLHRLDPVLRRYAWGSRTALAELCGRPSPTPEPEAELWFGTHPAAPAGVAGGGTLLELVEADPSATLGVEVAERFEGRLPFLVKLLAAAEPLSLQLHPAAAEARAGFAREEADGPARDAPTRVYRDPWPKPELLAALTPFDALCGFRDPAATVALLDHIDVAALAPVRERLVARGEAAFPELVERALHRGAWPQEERAEVADGFARVAGGGGRFAPEASWLGRLLERYPEDGGVEVAALLRLVRLAPGEALTLPAGTLHAYLSGTGVEVMASSDNVVRGGLTPKHVDVEELLRLLDARVLPRPVVEVTAEGAETHLPAPAEHFALSRVEVAGARVALDRRRGGPEVLVVTAGEVVVASEDDELAVPRGGGAFVPAATRELHLDGSGQVHRVRVGA
jgi:mannose-6-phosphate isomerase